MRIGKYKTRGFFKNRGRAIAASLGCRKDSVDSRWSDYDLRRERRCELISAYLHLLEKMNEPIASETVLPASKEQIRCAIFHELTEQPGSDRRHHLEIAYVQLESFVPQDEYRVVADFKKASRLAEMADLGDPASVIRSARNMRNARGEHAVSVEEKISRKMRERFKQIQELCSAALPPKPICDGARQLCG